MLTFPEPKPLDKLEIGAANLEAKMDEKLVGQYSLSNPHPGYGKDPNIINELGHTKYPKWVANKEGVQQLVQNEQEELEATGEEIKVEKKKSKGTPWT